MSPTSLPAKQAQQHNLNLSLRRVGGGGGGGGVASVPGSPAQELSRLVQLQRDKLQALESRLMGCEAEMQDWEGSPAEVNEVSENLIIISLIYLNCC